MKREQMNEILRKLLRANGIVTVDFDQMKEIRAELDSFIPRVEIEVIKSDFNKVSFRVLN